MVSTKTDDLLGVGLILLSIFLFFQSFQNTNLLLEIIGIVSSIFIFIAEIIYLYQKWFGGNRR